MQPRQRVKRYILENFLFTDDESAFADADSLIRAGIVDSTGIHELVMFIEESFGLSIAPEEMIPANFDSILAVDAFIGRKLAC